MTGRLLVSPYFSLCQEGVKKRALMMMLSLITSLDDKRWEREIECLEVLPLVK